MRKAGIFLVALFFVSILISTSYGEDAVATAKASFDKAKAAYIAAKETLSDAQIKSLRTVGRAEKDDAVKAVWSAKKEVKKAKGDYKAALKVLHEAEMARDAKIDRSPWR